VLSLAILFLLFESDGESDPLRSPALIPFLLLISLNVLIQLYFATDLTTFWQMIRGQDGPHPTTVMHNLMRISVMGMRNIVLLQSLARLVVIGAIFLHFVKRETERLTLLHAAILGMVPAAAITMLQVAGLHPRYFVNQIDFWQGQGRFCGTFTDPNAFGIFVLLILPFVAISAREATGVRRNLTATLIPVWFVLAGFSGSRSFYLGLLLFLAIFSWPILRGSKKILLALCALMIPIFLVNGAALFAPADFDAFLASAPSGLSRLATTLSWQHVGGALFSRLLFWNMGVRIWLDYPLLGVGYGRFRNFVPEYASRAGAEIGKWVDNSNNFYLGLLSEIGLPGLLALIWLIGRLRASSNDSPTAYTARRALLVLAALLAIGAHLDFDEVAVLCGVLLSLGMDVKNFETPRHAWTASLAGVILLAAIAIGMREYYLPRGFYGNRTATGRAPGWTARVAAAWAGCNADGKTTISITPLNPDLERNPLGVTLTGPCGTEEITLSRPGEVRKEVECICGGESTQTGRAFFQIELSRVWSPLKFGRGSDPRSLGVRLEFPPPAA
jgi:O-antigen ligase